MFQLSGLRPEAFTALFSLSDEELQRHHARRVTATGKPGFPCRVSLIDADIGEELILLPYTHQPAPTPYHASGPIFVRKGARQCVVPCGTIPDYVATRLMSVRAYDSAHFMIDASVCEGAVVAAMIREMFANPTVAYIQLHNAKRGCFSCTVNRMDHSLA
jgi:Protein of unknown function (DUF1203)